MALRTYTVAETAVIAMVGGITYFLFLHPMIPEGFHVPIGPWRTSIERDEPARLPRRGVIHLDYENPLTIRRCVRVMSHRALMAGKIARAGAMRQRGCAMRKALRRMA